MAIVPEPAKLRVTNENGIINIFRPETPTLLGVDLDSYLSPFPKDPRYTDPDKDGKPGVTVNISVGKFFNEDIYIARKEIFSYKMTLKGDKSIRSSRLGP